MRAFLVSAALLGIFTAQAQAFQLNGQEFELAKGKTLSIPVKNVFSNPINVKVTAGEEIPEYKRGLPANAPDCSAGLHVFPPVIHNLQPGETFTVKARGAKAGFCRLEFLVEEIKPTPTEPGVYINYRFRHVMRTEVK